MMRMVLVHPGEYVLPELGLELGTYANRVLSGRGIEIHPKSKVTAVTPRQDVVPDGSRIECFTLVWTAGTSPSPILDRIALPKERGKIKVSATLDPIRRRHPMPRGTPQTDQKESYYLLPD